MLDQIHIRNYKSLRDVGLDLRAFNVLIGPNNAGKSNVFDCLRLLSELTRSQQGEPVQSRGGFSSIVWNGEIRNSIGIEITGHEPSFPSQGADRYRFRYDVHIAGGPTHFQIASERFWAEDALPEAGAMSHIEKDLLKARPQGRVLLEYPVEQNMTRVTDPSGRALWGGAFGSSLSSYLSAFADPTRFPLVGDFALQVKNWAFYNFVPSLMEAPLAVRKDLRLQERGENFGAVLHSYHAEFGSNFREIEEWLRRAMPEISSLLTGLTEGGQTFAQIEESGLKVRIPSWSMSDGTIRFLAHLLVVFGASPPPLVCFEEPENFIHPHSLELLAHILKKASTRSQILLTTHSPYLLNFLEPEDVIIVEKHEGATEASRPKDPGAIKEALKTLGLGEMWYAGSLGGTP
jgi:predicted ATPase